MLFRTDIKLLFITTKSPFLFLCSLYRFLSHMIHLLFFCVIVHDPRFVWPWELFIDSNFHNTHQIPLFFEYSPFPCGIGDIFTKHIAGFGFKRQTGLNCSFVPNMRHFPGICSIWHAHDSSIPTPRGYPHLFSWTPPIFVNLQWIIITIMTTGKSLLCWSSCPCASGHSKTSRIMTRTKSKSVYTLNWLIKENVHKCQKRKYK